MFGQKLKAQRQQIDIQTPDMAKELGIHQTTISYFETREPVPIDLYLNHLAKHGIDLNQVLTADTPNIAKLLKKERQTKKITWQSICDNIGISQSSLSYMENRADTHFIIYLRYLAKRGADINKAFCC